MKVSVLLENGMFFEAESFGAEGTAVGEIVFNTSMTGYQEIITDPSYAGQFVVFTMPEIGNVGVNKDDMESKRAWLKGVIVREYVDKYSNFRQAFLCLSLIYLDICKSSRPLLYILHYL